MFSAIYDPVFQLVSSLQVRRAELRISPMPRPQTSALKERISNVVFRKGNFLRPAKSLPIYSLALPSGKEFSNIYFPFFCTARQPYAFI